MTPDLREKMTASAITAAKAANYTNAGTVEFLYANGNYYFMEVTPDCRWSIPSPSSHRIDIVKKQIAIAAGEISRWIRRI